MDNIWAFIVDIFVALVIIFLCVAVYFGLREEAVIKTLGTAITEDFLMEVKQNGHMSVSDYEDYIKRLNLTDTLYDLGLEHVHKMYGPLYRFRTIDEIIAAQEASYSGENIYNYRDVHTERPEVINPVYEGNLNTDTNDSILARAIDTPPSSSHVHTETCYIGHRHSDGGGTATSSYKHGCYTEAYSETVSCSGTIQYSGSYSLENKTFVCTGCRTSQFVYFTLTVIEYNCNKCGKYCNSLLYTCPECGDGFSQGASAGDPCGGTTVTMYRCPLAADTVPDCAYIIDELVPTNPIQTVAVGDPLITTAVATYRDGSTKTILCGTDFSTADTGQNKTAILTYSYTIDGMQFSVEASVTVSVIPRQITCINGHTYNLSNDGSDSGCPYCKAWIRELRIVHPVTSFLTITLGTTLQQNGVTLLAIYYDGHTETVNSAYEDNLDNMYLGTKPVIIGYKGETVQLMVTTVCAKIICDICGYEYSLYPDFTNPGCPGCISRTPVFTGEIMIYEEAAYTEDILEKLYEKGIYKFNVNDTFAVSLRNKSDTMARKILNRIYPAMSDRWFVLYMGNRIESK